MVIARQSSDRVGLIMIYLSHIVAHVDAALGHWSLVFDPCPLQAERSLRPFGIDYPSCLVGCCSLDLQAETSTTDRRHRALHDAGPKARSMSQGHVTRSTPLRHPCRRTQADTQKPAVYRSRANVPWTPFAGFGSPPVSSFTLSSSVPRHQITRPGRHRRNPARSLWGVLFLGLLATVFYSTFAAP